MKNVISELKAQREAVNNDSAENSTMELEGSLEKFCQKSQKKKEKGKRDECDKQIAIILREQSGDRHGITEQC